MRQVKDIFSMGQVIRWRESIEFRDVTDFEPVHEELEIRGELRPSYRYCLAAGALNLDLWYSPDRAVPAAIRAVPAAIMEHEL